MKRTFLALLFFLRILYSEGQVYNLVPNSSFEFSYSNFPIVVIDTSLDNPNVLCWCSASWFWSVCASSTLNDTINYLGGTGHYSYSGNRYVHLIQNVGISNSLADPINNHLADSSSNVRSYVETRLLQPLNAGQTYHLKMFVSRTYSVPGGINTTAKNLGVFFSQQKLMANIFAPNNTLLHQSPQVNFNGINFITDSITWIELNADYTATGGEQFIIIGNFDSFNNTQYALLPTVDSITRGIFAVVNIDNISLYPDTATTFISPIILHIGNDTVLCNNQSFSDTLAAQTGFFHYLWSNGDTGTSIIVTQPGIYWCSVDFGCNWFTDSIRISPDSSLNHFLPDDTALCALQYPFIITAPNNFLNYLWSTGDTINSITVNQPGWYWLQTATPCNMHRDSIDIGVKGGVFSGMPDLVLCEGDTLIAYGPPDFFYLWSTGSTDSILPIMQAGTYTLSATDVCGTYSGIFQVLSDSSPKIQLPREMVLCQGDVITLDATAGNSVYHWNTGDTSSFISVSGSGSYIVKASNQCGVDSMTTQIITENCASCFGTPNAFTPNDDGLNDEWKVIPLCADVKDFHVAIFNRWGEKIFETNDATQGWNGSFQNKKMEIGACVFYLTYKAAESGKQFSQKGEIDLLR
jgi:gliding motility-associated-like protein